MNLIRIRDLTPEDISELIRIHDEKDFPFPDLSNLLYMCKKAATINGKLIAAGLARLTSEGVLIIDKDQPVITKTNAITKLIETMINETSGMGMDECHVSVSNERMLKFLKGVGFELCLGKMMVISYG